MVLGITELNAYIMRILIRAHDWYTEGSLKHAWHSLTQPSELRFDDLIALISERSRVVDQLASSCQQAEFRDMHGKVDEMDNKINKIGTQLESFDTKLEVRVHTSKLSDLQFANIMAAISDHTIADPMKVLQHLQAAKRRASRTVAGSTAYLSPQFWNSPKLRNLDTSQNSDIAIVKGQFRSRQALRHFCVDVIQQFSDSDTPVIHALKLPQDCLSSPNISCIDLIKYVVRQALQLTQRQQTEVTMSLSCAPFHSNYSEAEWFQVLERVLSEFHHHKPVYLILDLELVNRDLAPSGGFPILTNFLAFFQRLAERQMSSTRLKVLLVVYGSELPFAVSQEQYSDFVIPAKVDSSRARQRMSRGKGAIELRKKFGARR
ncbi:hypothetical protein SLS62_008320 [Diatrype stigma]|uniref:DUF7708 domain-containing protein n=1 Tax=Diatrype stigma TaxID=117547 RepID=A0AAN9YM18_9PEZI